ncbi:MAG TPA: hypothetical protein VHV58_00405 [Pseudolabrys sp.]|nr:hypothetical protein [Pseudolabrys sp.]
MLKTRYALILRNTLTSLLPNCFIAGFKGSDTPGAIRRSRNYSIGTNVSTARVLTAAGKPMVARAGKKSTAEDIVAIEDLMEDLERRLRRVSGTTRREASGAADDVSDFVEDTLADIKAKVRAKAADAVRSAGDKASNLGEDTLRKLFDGVEERPLIMLGIAAGVGFLAGLATRR